MALVFDYVSLGIPLGSRKGKSIEVNMMWGEGCLWIPSLGLCKDMPFNAIVSYLSLPSPTKMKDAGAPGAVACSISP